MSDLKTRIIDAWLELNPMPHTEDEPKWQGPDTLMEPNFHHWKIARDKLVKHLACEAYESAVIQSFLPATGYRLVLLSQLLDGGWAAKLGNRHGPGGLPCSAGASPAEALLNAILASCPQQGGVA